MTVVRDINQVEDKWIISAFNRTQVRLPNCFTYAMARISQEVGYVQPLDTNKRVDGAQELWTNHDANFSQSSTAQVGALAIFEGGYPINGVVYGHVAYVEVVGDEMMLSQSNLGQVDANKNPILMENVQMSKVPGARYPGNDRLILKGFLIHKDLAKKQQVDENPPKNNKGFKYRVLEQNVGWGPWVHDGMIAGSTGKSHRIEAIQIEPLEGDRIDVEAHFANIGWKLYPNITKNTIIVGGKGGLEAIKVTSKKYDLGIEVHVSNYGWTGETGEVVTGTTGISESIEAIKLWIK